jgi:uncharacterized protein (TIGR02391 family)
MPTGSFDPSGHRPTTEVYRMLNDPILIRRVAEAYQLMSKIRAVAIKQLDDLENGYDEATPEVKAIMVAHLEHLNTVLPEIKATSNLARHVHFNMRGDHLDIVSKDLPQIEKAIAKLLEVEQAPNPESKTFGFEDLLDPTIRAKALPLYAGGHHRHAVLEAYTLVFNEIRKRTKRTDDGADLIGATLSLKKPMLVLEELDTESGQNTQKGYIQLLQGAYQAFRNVLAHSGPTISVTPDSAARHMIFASMLLRKIVNAKLADSV